MLALSAICIYLGLGTLPSKPLRGSCGLLTNEFSPQRQLGQPSIFMGCVVAMGITMNRIGEACPNRPVYFYFAVSSGSYESRSQLFFLAQPNERLSIVGHLDTSATMIKKMFAAHAKHRTKHNKNQHRQNNPTQQRNSTCSRQSEKGETVRHPKRSQWSNSSKKPHSSAAHTQPP